MRYLILSVIVLLAGCANYQFGDGTRAALSAANKIITLKRDYCSGQSGESRELILATIRLIDHEYDGVCD